MANLASPEIAARAPVGKRTCFVIAPIGLPDSDTRKKSDQVLKHVIKKALEPDYAVERADDIGRPGVITVQIVQRIFDADLVVADLSDRNPNVYYELAIRHATKKPAVHIISEGQDIPFDVQDMRVVPYDLTDPDSLEKARGKLREYTKAIEEGETIITPVQFAQILRSLEADEGRDRQLRTLFESLNVGISNLQAAMGEIAQAVREQRQREAWQGPRGLRLTPTPPALDVTSPPASGFTFPSSLAAVLESVHHPPAVSLF